MPAEAEVPLMCVSAAPPRRIESSSPAAAAAAGEAAVSQLRSTEALVVARSDRMEPTAPAEEAGLAGLDQWEAWLESVAHLSSEVPD